MVAEEGEECFGEGALRAYENRLAEKGCVRISYPKLDGWVALSQKWRLLGTMAAESSEMFVLKAGDCFSYPERLWHMAQRFEDPAVDWVQTPKGYFYDFGFKQMSLDDYELTPPYASPRKGWEVHPCALNMALRTRYTRELPDEDVKRGVDGWLFGAMEGMKGSKGVIGWVDEDGWQKGVDTHGLNNISLVRSERIEKNLPPFRATDAVIEDILTADVLARLGSVRSAALERSCHVMKNLADENEAKMAKLEAKLEDFRGMVTRRNEKIERLEATVSTLRNKKFRLGRRLFGRGSK